MLKKLLFSFSLIQVFLFSSNAHPWKPSHYVIIDTDAGIDDMRAISLLLASPDVRVLGIIASPGALPATEAYIKVKSLLNTFHHEGLLLSINDHKGFVSPRFSGAVRAEWGDEKGITAASAPSYLTMLEEIFSAEASKVSFISMAGLNSAAMAAEKSASFRTRVKEIIFSTSEVPGESFNENIDREAYNKVRNSTPELKLIEGFSKGIFFSKPFLESLSKLKGIYPETLTKHFNSSVVAEHSFALNATDEMLPLYLHYPSLFQRRIFSGESHLFAASTDSLQDKFLLILDGATVAKNQVIKAFPFNPSFYFDDLAPFASEIINRHGDDEWVSGVIANELHRHLGVFAIIGVKMGIRAREYFCTGVDEFMASSYAGSTPPLSCMNDGIQVSTGATPGHGLLNVINSETAAPTVVFTYMGRKLKISLHPDIASMISAELKEINFVYGLDSNIYWELVRKNSIKYWLSMDRHDIFELQELNE